MRFGAAIAEVNTTWSYRSVQVQQQYHPYVLVPLCLICPGVRCVVVETDTFLFAPRFLSYRGTVVLFVFPQYGVAPSELIFAASYVLV